MDFINTLVPFIEANLSDLDPLLSSVTLAILFLTGYDFYHLLFSTVLSWFKKD